MTRKYALAAAILLAASLSACGLTGPLQRPGPLIGNPSGDVDPASLPDGQARDLPALPDRPQSEEEAAEEEDELLGGPGAF